MEISQSWEQQPDEPHEWFARFQRFKLLGPQRSLLAAYNEERVRKSQKKAGSAPPGWRKNQKSWNWQSRAEAWDNRQQHKSEARWERKQQDWEKRREDLREREWDLSEQLLKRAEEMMRYPLAEAKWGLRDAATYMELASKLARSAAGSDAISEIEAVKVLVEAGWLPEGIVETIADKFEEAREVIKSTFLAQDEVE